MNPNKTLIESGYKFVLAVSGGGQEIVGELTRHGEISNTLLEAIVPYSQSAFVSLVGGKPDRIVSPEAARMAAMACYRKAIAYSTNDDKVFGFASTGAIVRVGGEREGRKHRVHMAIQDRERTIGINLEFRPGRTRQEEEQLTADCIRVGLMWGSHRFADLKGELLDGDTPNVEFHIADPEMQNLIHGGTSDHKTPCSGVVFASSCNPLHDAHIAMMEDASKRIGKPVDIELCVVNADKPPLDYLTLQRRLEATRLKVRGNPHIGNVIPTNKPMFFDKAELFPGATFVMGHDTYDRILNPKYYADGNDTIKKSVLRFLTLGCNTLVYPRKGYTPVHHASHMNDPFFMTFVDESDGYAPSDISSTQIRQGIIHAES